MASDRLRYRVEGMDCASCAAKIENALVRIEGVADVQLNYAAEKLNFRYAGSALSDVEEKIRSLGYTPHREENAGARKPKADEKTAWWAKPKAKLAIAIGVILAIAFIASHVAPDYADIFYIIAALAGIVPFGRRAAVLAVSGSPFSIELLMVVAAIGAVLIGEAEEAAVVVFLFAVGEVLENVAAGKARAGIQALIDLVPRTAIRRADGQDKEVAADQLAVGDIIVVRPGDRVASDGAIVEGASELDQSPITGESVPVAKSIGAEVHAGSINTTGVLIVRVTHTAEDNTISRIVHLVEEAQASKASIARFIDRFSAWYTPDAMAAAALVIVIPPLFLDEDWHTWIYRGLALLLIACPCALVISTPAAIASGLSAGARRGLLIKGGLPLETLSRVKTIAFDKTGTLTAGRPRVTDLIAFGKSEDEVLARAAAVEKGSSHPLAKAILVAAEEKGVKIPTGFGASAIAGKGATARLTDGFVLVGSPRHAAETSSLPEEVATRIRTLEDEGKTVVVVSAGKTVEGIIAMRDEPRADAREAILNLRARGIRPLMLTGDNARTGKAIASALALDVEAELLPHDKLKRIEALKRDGGVAMIGDGINDAPALAAASVGVAMGGGTDVALETADAALLQNNVSGVVDLVDLSRATLGNIRQNIGAALGLKAIFLVTTLIGATSLWMAILADTGATVLVTANAMRLLNWRGVPKR
ncbi:ATPase [Terrihabitans soli]|uniref:P-type Zn(2+) transporter n=1 Tax=Terrihabitans soli TaxID=708113 RepID=A0A6S6QHF1_9HYPH|nr:heavy metal translocating P-type ATPase [Terrihabitans soli]BCJ90603.1 ATPase [Terrihabitans soli]